MLCLTISNRLHLHEGGHTRPRPAANFSPTSPLPVHHSARSCSGGRSVWEVLLRSGRSVGGREMACLLEAPLRISVLSVSLLQTPKHMAAFFFTSPPPPANPHRRWARPVGFLLGFFLFCEWLTSLTSYKKKRFCNPSGRSTTSPCGGSYLTIGVALGGRA